MALVKCPRCELNYMQSTEQYCTVCSREVFGKDHVGGPDVCPNCGERPVANGEDYCVVCPKEMNSTEGFAPEVSDVLDTASSLDLAGASEMDEIDIDIDQDDIPDSMIAQELEQDEDFGAISLDELAEQEANDEDEEDA